MRSRQEETGWQIVWQIVSGTLIGLACSLPVFAIVSACNSTKADQPPASTPWADGRAQRAAQEARYLLQLYGELDRTARFLIEEHAATLGPNNVADMRGIVGRLLTDYQQTHGLLLAELLLAGQGPQPAKKE